MLQPGIKAARRMSVATCNEGPSWQVRIVPDFGTFEGPFDITSIEYSGEYNGEAQYSMSFESAGQITFTAA